MVSNTERKDDKILKLGLRPNIHQFLLLMIVNAFVGAMVGLEQTVVPLLGKNEFGIESNAVILSFIASFGMIKAILNLFAGSLSDKWGRKNVLILGWLFGIPVPIILLLAPDWNWIIFANILLGINQGLAWSMTVNMKVDLVGKYRRGLALGLNEFAGYVSVALVGFMTGYLAASYGLKPYPFYLGISFALLGFFISLLMVKDTRKFTDLEIKTHFQDNVSREKEEEEEKQKLRKKSNAKLDKEVGLDSPTKNKNDVNRIKKTLDFKQAFIETSWNNRSLLAASQAGLINNLIFGMSWGLFTLYFVSLGISLTDTALLKTLHPAIWGFLQLATGPISDNIGRKKLIYSGMIIQASGLWTILVFKNEFTGLFAGMSLLGIGTAFVYPTLLAAISDIANPQWRATSLGVYRFWRDLGFVFGAVGVGFISDVFNANIAIQAVALISLASGIVVILLMKETKKN